MSYLFADKTIHFCLKMNSGRPKRSRYDVEKIISLFIEHKEDIINDGKLISRSNRKWQELSTVSNLSALALYTIVAKNYYDIKDVLGLEREENYCSSVTEPIITDKDMSDDSDSFSITSEESDDKIIKFVLEFSHEEFDKLFYHVEEYGRSDRYEKNSGDRKSYKRRYFVFQQRHWTHVISKKIDQSLRQKNIPCVFYFKRNKVHPHRVNLQYLKATAKTAVPS